MGSTKVSQPEPPSVQNTAAASIQAQIAALPQMLQAQQQYGGQFTEEEIKLLEQYGPRAAQATKDVMAVSSPEALKAQELLTNYLSTPSGFSATEEEGIRADLRAATSVRGMGESGFSALEEVRGLQDLRNQLKMQQINVALSSVGRLPSGMGTSMTQAGYSPGQLVQNVNPSQIFGLASNNYSTQAGMYNTNKNAAVAVRGQNIGLLSDMYGAAASVGGAAIGMCWCAKEVYGSWDDERTVNARAWMITKSPKLLRTLYAKYGERFAQYISNKPLLKMIVKFLFDLVQDKGKEIRGGVQWAV